MQLMSPAKVRIPDASHADADKSNRARCNRQQPCSYCSARDLKCVYASDHAPSASRPPAEARLAQLERLVLSMIPPEPQSDQICRDSSGNIDIDTPSETGRMHVNATAQHYVGGEHWDAILDSIADLKQHFRYEEQLEHSDLSSPQHDTVEAVNERTPLFYGSFPLRSRDGIISGLPTRSVVDRCLARYFNFVDVAACEDTHLIQKLSFY